MSHKQMHCLSPIIITTIVTLASPGASANPPQGFCNAHGWCWTNPIPQGNSLQAVWQSPSKALWAVGDAGTVLVRRGGSWQLLPTVETWHANVWYTSDIWGCADNNVWIAAGDFWNYDGQRWTRFAAPDGSRFDRLDGRGCSDIWAVGKTKKRRGAIARWNGERWSSIKTPVQYARYFDVLVLEDTVLFTADKNGQSRGSVLSWEETNWDTTDLGSTMLLSLSKSHRGVAWGAVHGIGQGKAAYLSPKGWNISKVGTKHRIARVRSLAPNNVYAIGSSKELAKWNGSSWSTLDTSGQQLTDIGLDDRGETWGVGTRGTVIQLTTEGSKSLTRGFRGRTNRFWHDGAALWSIGTTSQDEPVLLSWFAGLWHQVALPSESREFGTVWGSGPGNLWLGGAGGQLLYYNGTKWERHIVEPRVGWRAIVGYSAKDIWAFANGGLAAHYNGSRWQLHDGLTLEDLYDATRVGREIWVVGTNGTLLRHSKRRGWRQRKVPGASTLLAIAAASPRDVYVAGEGGEVFHWNGRVWSKAATLSDGYVRDIAHRDGTWWAVGDSGYWSKQQSSKWTQAEVGATNRLSAVYPGVDGSVWIGGAGGAILRRPGSKTPPPFSPVPPGVTTQAPVLVEANQPSSSPTPWPAKARAPSRQPRVKISTRKDTLTIFVSCSVANPFQIALEPSDKKEVSGSVTPLNEVMEIKKSPLAPYLIPSAKRSMHRFAYVTEQIAGEEQMAFTMALRGPISLRLPRTCGGDSINLGATGHWSAFSATLYGEEVYGEDGEQLALTDIDIHTHVNPALLRPHKGDLLIDAGLDRLFFTKADVVPHDVNLSAILADSPHQLCNTPITLTAARVSPRICHNEYPPNQPRGRRHGLGLDMEDVTLVIPKALDGQDKEPKVYHLDWAFLDGKGLRGGTMPAVDWNIR